jgi:hypothetical protein
MQANVCRLQTFSYSVPRLGVGSPPNLHLVVIQLLLGSEFSWFNTFAIDGLCILFTALCGK